MLNNSEYVKKPLKTNRVSQVQMTCLFEKIKIVPFWRQTQDNNNESSLSYIQRTTLIILSFSNVKRGGNTEEFFTGVMWVIILLINIYLQMFHI